MKKTAALLLVIILGISVVCCSNGGSGHNDATNSQKYAADLPEKDYGGGDFVILQREYDQGWGEKGFFADDTSGNVFSESVYRRNSVIEDRYSVHLDIVQVNDQNIAGGALYRKAYSSLSSFTDDYDLILPSVYDAITFSNSGLLLNLGELPYLDLEADWWSKKLNDSIAIGGKQYFAISDTMFNDKLDSAIILFNDKILADKGLDAPYKYVTDKTWTVDRLSQYIKNYGGDVDSDGIQGYNDRYGIFFLEYSGLVVGSGITGAKLNGEGIPELNPLTAKEETVFDKLLNLVTAPYQVFNMYNYGGEKMDTYSNASPNEVIDAIWRKFRDGDTMFCACSVECIAYYLTDMDCYGVLPYPLADENQDTYYNRVGHTGATFITVPFTVEDPERSAILVEDLSCEAKNIMSPAFYDVLLGVRSVRDDESAGMLDLIFENEILDLDLVYEWGAFVVRWHTLLHFGEGNIASSYAEAIESAEEKLQNTLNSLGLAD